MEQSKIVGGLSCNEKQFRLGYLSCLDGLRGFAVLVVIAFHANVPFLQGGLIGVDIFFVLSGFLITALLIQEWEQYGKINFKNFYIRRALRLLPALVALLFIYVIVASLFPDNPRNHILAAFIALVNLTNWARAFDWEIPSFLGHTWSLSIEGQFYLLWPPILMILLRYMQSRFLITIIVFSSALFLGLYRVYMLATGASVSRLYNGLDTRADSLLLGCVVGIAIASNLIPKDNRILGVIKYASIVSWLGLLVMIVVARLESHIMYYYGYFIISIFSGFIILSFFLYPSLLPRKMMNKKWLVWLGRISYGLYLWHYPVFRVLQLKVSSSWLLVLIIGGGLSIFIATLSFYFLERPLFQLKSSFKG